MIYLITNHNIYLMTHIFYPCTFKVTTQMRFKWMCDLHWRDRKNETISLRVICALLEKERNSGKKEEIFSSQMKRIVTNDLTAKLTFTHKLMKTLALSKAVTKLSANGSGLKINFLILTFFCMMNDDTPVIFYFHINLATRRQLGFVGWTGTRNQMKSKKRKEKNKSANRWDIVVPTCSKWPILGIITHNLFLHFNTTTLDAFSFIVDFNLDSAKAIIQASQNTKIENEAGFVAFKKAATCIWSVCGWLLCTWTIQILMLLRSEAMKWPSQATYSVRAMTTYRM